MLFILRSCRFGALPKERQHARLGLQIAGFKDLREPVMTDGYMARERLRSTSVYPVRS